MEKNASREYLNSLSAEERKALAAKVGVAQEYLYMIAKGSRTPSRKVAVHLEAATHRRVKAADFDSELKAALA